MTSVVDTRPMPPIFRIADVMTSARHPSDIRYGYHDIRYGYHDIRADVMASDECHVTSGSSGCRQRPSDIRRQ